MCLELGRGGEEGGGECDLETRNYQKNTSLGKCYPVVCEADWLR